MRGLSDTKPTSFLVAAARLMRVKYSVVAIANSLTALFLRSATGYGDEWNIAAIVMLSLMSLGLFCFAVVTNDIIDLRRDRYLYPDRPLSSGAITIQQAYLIAAGLLVVGVSGGVAYALTEGGGFASVFFLAWLVVLIFFFNLAGKFVGGVGLLTLGLIGFFHAAVGQPRLSVIWHPLLIMDHVAAVAFVVYALEGRRPRLSRGHGWGLLFGLIGLNVLFAAGIVLIGAIRARSIARGLDVLNITEAWLYPAIAALVFAAFLVALMLSLRPMAAGEQPVRQLVELRRRMGSRVQIFGVVWLIVYDMAFIYGYIREL